MLLYSQSDLLRKWLFMYCCLLNAPSLQFKTDVVGCSVDKQELQVLAIDTYNPAAPDKFNILDDSEVSSNGEAVSVWQRPLQ